MPRGRPRTPSRLSRSREVVEAAAADEAQRYEPTGVWIDSDVLPRRVAAIVGARDERDVDGAEKLAGLERLSRRLLRRKLTSPEREALHTLLFTKRAPASIITRVLVAWQHGVGERDVRRMLRTLHAAVDSEGNDITGKPVLDPETGRPVLDSAGSPVKHRARPRVKMFYR